MINTVLILASVCCWSGGLLEESQKIRARIIYEEKKIVGLDLYQANFSDSWLSKLKKFPEITILQLNGKDVSDQTLAVVSSLKQIRALRLGPICNVTALGVADLKRLPHLEELRLESLSIGDDGLKSLAEFDSLKSVQLPANATVEGLKHVLGLKKVTKLSLAECKLIDDDLRWVAKMLSLTSIDLQSTAITGQGLRHLASSRINMLDLTATKLSDDGMSGLKALTKLTHLNLSKTEISNQGMKSIGEIDGLEVLHLVQCERLTDTALLRLKNKRLWLLNLNGCIGISGTEFHSLESLPKLRTIDISGCEMIGDKEFVLLATIRTLREIIILGTKVSPEAIKQVQGKRTDMKILYFGQ